MPLQDSITRNQRASRRLRWISSVNPKNDLELDLLQRQLAGYYTHPTTYYQEIRYAGAGWNSDDAYLAIARNLPKVARILEVGCGSANVLSCHPDIESSYTGVDFSQELLTENARQHPQAKFRRLEDPKRLPFNDAVFERVFSTYVLEHCVFPKLFLGECCRVLAPGGLFMMLCPNFLGRGRMPSQRAGFSPLTGREKIQKGRFLDAITTGFDRKLRLPLAAAMKRRAMRAGKEGFWINTAPTCFVDDFYADCDAVYLTYDVEIIRELEQLGLKLIEQGREKDRIFLVARRSESSS